MEAIKTSSDGKRLRTKREIPNTIMEQLEKDFLELMASLNHDDVQEQVDLADHGYIVLLQRGDDVRDLHEVGLNPEDDGLLGSTPEYVNLLA